jgi:hypothetical protein
LYDLLTNKYETPGSWKHITSQVSSSFPLLLRCLIINILSDWHVL